MEWRATLRIGTNRLLDKDLRRFWSCTQAALATIQTAVRTLWTSPAVLFQARRAHRLQNKPQKAILPKRRRLLARLTCSGRRTCYSYSATDFQPFYAASPAKPVATDPISRPPERANLAGRGPDHASLEPRSIFVARFIALGPGGCRCVVASPLARRAQSPLDQTHERRQFQRSLRRIP